MPGVTMMRRPEKPESTLSASCEPAGVGIKGVVNDGHNPGNELQAMLDGLDYAHAAGNFFH